MPSVISLISVHGIPVRMHLSAVFAFFLLLFLLASVYFPALLPNERTATYWSVAFISTLFLFLSTLAHELGHSLVARARGLRAESITLFMFGGSSDIRREGERPLDELFVAISGPSVSMCLAALALAGRMTIPNPSQPMMLFLESVLLLNLFLGAFNLLPSLPLDGGRAMRGLLWQQTGDFLRATRAASVLSRGFALLMVVAGIALLIVALDGERAPITNILGYDARIVGVALVLLAWFLNSGARNALRQVEMQEKFRGVIVSQVMSHEPSTVVPWTSVEEIVNHYFLQKGERAVAVVREGDVLMGLVAYNDVRRTPRADWPNRAAGEIMTPVGRLIVVSPTDSIESAIRHMAEGHYNQLPVVEDGRLVGMISRVNVLRFVNLEGDFRER